MYYRSEKVLGKLYRGIDEQKIWNEEIRSTASPRPAIIWKILITNLTKRCIDLGASGNVETARQLRAA